VASNALPEAQALVQRALRRAVQLDATHGKGRPSARAVALDLQDGAALDALIAAADVVVSFVPAPLHPVVARRCIALRRHLVTASYLSPELAALGPAAEEAGICIMNECGLDPGIDHLTAMRYFDEVRGAGGRVVGFESWCGGLPAPECADNPLGYKFSWAPRGVLAAACNSAAYKLGGRLVSTPGPALLDAPTAVPVAPGFHFEGIPNRDSLKYAAMYGLGPVEGLHTMFRGTLRYPGYAEVMNALKAMGLLGMDPYPWAQGAQSSGAPPGTWPALLARLRRDRERAGLPFPSLGAAGGASERVLDALHWLGMHEHPDAARGYLHTPEGRLALRAPFAAERVDAVPAGAAWIDVLCALLLRRLPYRPGERDMCVMQHRFDARWPDGRAEVRTWTLIAHGEPGGYSAMARTVGLPAAVAADMLLSGELKRRGVLAPVTRDVYGPMLAALEARGIRFQEHAVRSRLPPGV
jgi:alpha-aminoadipic semialdehyde synthase